jgi:hypothetical protein
VAFSFWKLWNEDGVASVVAAVALTVVLIPFLVWRARTLAVEMAVGAVLVRRYLRSKKYLLTDVTEFRYERERWYGTRPYVGSLRMLDGRHVLLLALYGSADGDENRDASNRARIAELNQQLAAARTRH